MQQASQLRDNVLGQGIGTLFRKPTAQGGGGLLAFEVFVRCGAVNSHTWVR